MERKECANGLQLIKIACMKLKGKFSAMFIGALAMTTPLILLLYVPALMSMLFETGWIVTVGVVLFAILVAPLQMGYIKYFNNVMDGNQPRISEVYSYLRFSAITLRSIYISGLLIVMYLVGGILWMVPAGFAVSAYSMTLFFLQKFEYPRLSQAMNECSKKMMGNRLAMFSYKLIFYLVYFMLFVLCGLFFALIHNLSFDSFVISWLVAVCSAIVFIFLYTMVTVYFHSSNQIFFEDVLSRDEKKRQAKIQTKMNNTDNVVSTSEKDEKKAVENKEKNVEDNDVVDEKKDSEPKTTKTSSVKKSTSTKKTTTKKPATKKTTTKKSETKKVSKN
ncbi:MAG: hypothetical protein IJW59_05240 [Clostridia bacterium]|nr:hypothetical protein [Clostridia bacterium]